MHSLVRQKNVIIKYNMHANDSIIVCTLSVFDSNLSVSSNHTFLLLQQKKEVARKRGYKRASDDIRLGVNIIRGRVKWSWARRRAQNRPQLRSRVETKRAAHTGLHYRDTTATFPIRDWRDYPLLDCEFPICSETVTQFMSLESHYIRHVDYNNLYISVREVSRILWRRDYLMDIQSHDLTRSFQCFNTQSVLW